MVPEPDSLRPLAALRDSSGLLQLDNIQCFSQSPAGLWITTSTGSRDLTTLSVNCSVSNGGRKVEPDKLDESSLSWLKALPDVGSGCVLQKTMLLNSQMPPGEVFRDCTTKKKSQGEGPGQAGGTLSLDWSGRASGFP